MQKTSHTPEEIRLSLMNKYQHLWAQHRLIVLTAIFILVTGLAHFETLDDAGQEYTQSAFKRALITFGVARGLNAVISVAQGTELAVQPAGVGVVFTPGEILDPVNDLVERFSWVMLASTTSLGIQLVLLKVTSSTVFTWLFTLGIGLFLILIWWRRAIPAGIQNTIFRIAIFLLVLRFLIPVITIANEGLYRAFLQPEYNVSAMKLEEATDNIGEINVQGEIEKPTERKGSLVKKLEQAFDAAADSMNIRKRMESLRQAADEIAEHTINLIVVFVLQTILFPLLFLWIGLHLARQVFRLELKQKLE